MLHPFIYSLYHVFLRDAYEVESGIWQIFHYDDGVKMDDRSRVVLSNQFRFVHRQGVPASCNFMRFKQWTRSHEVAFLQECDPPGRLGIN